MVTPMIKVQVGIPRRYVHGVMAWLQEEAVLHVTEIKQPSETRHNDSEIDQQLAYIQFALEFIARVRRELNIQRQRSWRDLFAGKPTAQVAGLEQCLQNISITKIDNQVRKISDELAVISARQQEIERVLKEIEPWRSLKVTGRELKAPRSFYYVLLTVGMQEDRLVKRELMSLETAVWQEVRRVAEKKKGRVYLEAAVDKSETEKLNKIILETNATVVNLLIPDDRTVGEYAEALRREMKTNRQFYQANLEKGRGLFKLERQLMFAYDGLLHRQERLIALQQGWHLPHVTVITGWLPQARCKAVREELEEEFPGVAVEVDHGAKDEPPVALSNSRLIEPFEAVTNIFGQPKYHELDPTGPMALFFLISFSLALTDAGYGLVMMLMMWGAERYLRLKRAMKKMVRLLFYAGQGTVVAGALTGGWFGINLEALPAGEVRQLLLSIKLIDPVKDLMGLLLVALAVGITQLLFAWLVRAYDHARQKKYSAMLLDDLVWVVMVVALLLWAGSSRGWWLENVKQLLLISWLTMAGVAILTGGRGFKNPLLKLGGGILSLWGLVSFLSDTLSYSRLLALGLATGVIGLVVNMLGMMIGSSVPVVGWFIAAAVLIIGHVFNLGINALGAFIHSGRLQFVEFFPKFMTGGGKPYRPLGRVSKYVDNPKEFI